MLMDLNHVGCVPFFGKGGFEAFEAFEAEESKGGGECLRFEGADEGFEGFEGDEGFEAFEGRTKGL